MVSNNKYKVLEALKNPKNWKPDLTRISKQTGIPISTIFSIYNSRIKNLTRIDLNMKVILEFDTLIDEIKFCECEQPNEGKYVCVLCDRLIPISKRKVM